MISIAPALSTRAALCAAALAALLAAGCVSTPPEVAARNQRLETYGPVLTRQRADAARSCAELTEEMARLEFAIADLDDVVAGLTQNAREFQQTAAMSAAMQSTAAMFGGTGAPPGMAAMNDMQMRMFAADIDRWSGRSENYRARYDHLITVHADKDC